MSSHAGAAGTPPPPPNPVVRYADILFVNAVLDSAGGNPKGRRVVVLTPDDALAAGFPIVAAPVTSQIPPAPGSRPRGAAVPQSPGDPPSGHRTDPAGRDRRHLAGGRRPRGDRWVLRLRAAADHGRRPRQDRGRRESPRRLALIGQAAAGGPRRPARPLRSPRRTDLSGERLAIRPPGRGPRQRHSATARPDTTRSGSESFPL